jgi:hypothetical protein
MESIFWHIFSPSEWVRQCCKLGDFDCQSKLLGSGCFGYGCWRESISSYTRPGRRTCCWPFWHGG